MTARPLEDQLADMHKANDKLMDVVMALSSLTDRVIQRNAALEEEIGRLLQAHEMLRSPVETGHSLGRP
jgi:uncharacterized protein YaaN involved in tellurite resistance